MSRLDKEIDRLLELLAQAGVQPTWSWIALVDAADVQHGGSAGQILRIPRQALRRQDVYSSRFEEHLRAGYSWINLSAAGAADGALVVVVEVPRTSSEVPSDQVAVNLSGTARQRIEIVASPPPAKPVTPPAARSADESAG